MTDDRYGASETHGGGEDLDVVVIGAGITGLHALYRLLNAGFRARILEAGGGVGGTWYWNRYPGARFDSESYTYGYFFSKDLFEEWEWSEHFAGQEEIERYLNHVVDRFEMRDDIQLNTRVKAASFDSARNRWTVLAEDGSATTTRFLLPAVGILSAPYIPEYAGLATFKGEILHTGLWPRTTVDVAGKRVAVIGTGSSGVQVVQTIAAEVSQMTVYQRTANWSGPLHNRPITEREQAEIKVAYDELRALCGSTYSGFMHGDPGIETFDHTERERRAHYERVWNTPGFAKLFSNYSDLVRDVKANQSFSAFVAEKIRDRVDDPELAEKLIPKDHGFGMKRPPMETGYYEAFNRANVALVDMRDNPIVRVTPAGIETADGDVREFDIIVFATGFDAVTGSLVRIDIKGPDGGSLSEFWADGPRTYLGLQVPGYPNLLIVGGPHGTFGNIPRSTEGQVDFVCDMLEHMREYGLDRVETDEAAEEEWTTHVYDAAAPVLVADSTWYMGSNIPGKPRRFLLYSGSLVDYAKKIEGVAREGYSGFNMTAVESAAEAATP